MPRDALKTAQPSTQSDALGEPRQGQHGGVARPPSYRRHKASGQAVVTLGGRDVYLGTYGTKASRAEYQRRLGEWLASGSPRGLTGDPRAELTVNELVLAYWRYVKTAYKVETRDGTIAPTLRRLRLLYGPTRVADFGPLKLKAYRQALIDERKAWKDDPTGAPRRLSRPYCNRSVREVRRMFRWGVGEELVAPTVLHGLQAVEGLRLGRTDAPEPKPVLAVPDATVEATLAHLPPVVADMVRIQRLTGMRPGELCQMTAAEIDTSGEVWLYAPKHHKTAHQGKSRIVPIGPRAQAVLGKYLRPELRAPLFSPAESEQERKRLLRQARQTPMTPSQAKRDARRARQPRRTYQDAYGTMSYATAVWRACDKAGVPRWSPNQLRHAKATELRKAFGLDAAGAVLGHSKLETTQIYAERSADLATKAALATG